MTRYVVTGDSQAEGLMSPLRASLGARLVGAYDHRGWSSRRLLDEGAIQTAAGTAAANGATMVVVAGGNDPIPDTPTSLEAYKQTLLEILRTVARKSAATSQPIKLVWFGPVFALHEYDETQHPAVARAQRAILNSSEAARAVREIPGAQLSWRWVDSQPLTRDLARVSNVHLTADGYRTYARRVIGQVEGGGLVGLALLGAVGYGVWRATR